MNLPFASIFPHERNSNNPKNSTCMHNVKLVVPPGLIDVPFKDNINKIILLIVFCVPLLRSTLYIFLGTNVQLKN